jgi:uncharacterized protein with PIN domain
MTDKSSDKERCDICNKQTRNVSRQPTRSQLLFGGFNITTENRCTSCERNVVLWIDRLLSQSR